MFNNISSEPANTEMPENPDPNEELNIELFDYLAAQNSTASNSTDTVTSTGSNSTDLTNMTASNNTLLVTKEVKIIKELPLSCEDCIKTNKTEVVSPNEEGVKLK